MNPTTIKTTVHTDATHHRVNKAVIQTDSGRVISRATIAHIKRGPGSKIRAMAFARAQAR